MREIVPDIFTWSRFAEPFGYDFNGYLVRHVTGALVVDPVDMGDEVLAEIAATNPTRILLTNRNHFRAAAKVAARTGAPVAVHAADAAFVRDHGVPVAESLAPGQRVGPFYVVDASGKSPGEVALHWPERRLLVVGDACVGKAPGALGLLPDAVIDDGARLRASLRRLAELDVDALLLADGHAILTGAGAVLRAFAASLTT